MNEKIKGKGRKEKIEGWKYFFSIEVKMKQGEKGKNKYK